MERRGPPGVEIERDEGNYVVTLEGGDRVAIPEAVVESVRLIGSGEPEVKRADPRRVAGPAPPEGPSGLVRSDPTTLAGPTVRPPTPREQLEVFGEPARFQRDIIDNRWTPSSDWDLDPERGNNFAPSRWAEDVVDNAWSPTSAFDTKKDVLAGSRSTWQRSIVGSEWTPSDGFSR